MSRRPRRRLVLGLTRSVRMGCLAGPGRRGSASGHRVPECREAEEETEEHEGRVPQPIELLATEEPVDTAARDPVTDASGERAWSTPPGLVCLSAAR